MLALREAAAPLVSTLAPHAASESWEDRVPKDIPRVLPRIKSQDGVSNWGAFVAVTGAATSVHIVVTLKAATTSSASVATSTATASTGFCDL